mmetsp:Transcript_15132/g.22322  ORF Transcript_15132/g.22322 Transcript_15132/m.22322 type:complete len:247 (+) Transcript_15132:8-748(+)
MLSFFLVGGALLLSCATANRIPIDRLDSFFGKNVEVEGFVTVASGTFASSYCYDSNCTMSDCGFAMQDTSGGGIWVAFSCSSSYAKVQIDNRVIVKGTVNLQGGGTSNETILAIFPVKKSSVMVVKGESFNVLPIHQKIHEVSGTGQLIQVVGTVIQRVNEVSGGDPTGCITGCYGFFIWLAGSSRSGSFIRVFFNVAPGTDFNYMNTNFTIGDRLKVIGMSGRYLVPEIDPRFKADVTLLPPLKK